jgi:hypothetical protein
MKRFARFAIALSTVALLALLVNCGGSSSSAPPPLPITVSVAPAASIVAAGATQILTATLQNDTAKVRIRYSPGICGAKRLQRSLIARRSGILSQTLGWP